MEDGPRVIRKETRVDIPLPPGEASLLRVVVALFRALQKFWEHGDLFSGAAISFYSLFSLLPLSILLLVALQAIFPAEQVEFQITRLFGNATNTDLLIRTLRDAYAQRGSLGWTGGVVLILAATGVFAAVQTALDRVWEAHGRLLPVRLIVGVLMMAGSLLIFLGVLVPTLLALRLFQFTVDVLGWTWEPGFPSGRALSLTAAVAQFGIFWMGYRFLPSMPVRWRDAWPGALLAVVLWQLTGYVLGVYLGSIPTYALLYNRLGAVLALLTWVYALACTFLVGAEFVAQWIPLRRAEVHLRKNG
jgi:membrane protein